MAALSEEVPPWSTHPRWRGKGGRVRAQSSGPSGWPGAEARVAPRLFTLPLHRSLSCDVVSRSRGWPGVWWGWSHLGAVLLPLPHCG